MLGYYGDDEDPIDSDGWLHTGDRGVHDDGGYLWITGRFKDLIIRGGENIAPLTVERALTDLPGVVDAAVFGLPHADLGEQVAAFVQISAELTDERDLDQRLVADLRSRISSFAVPTWWRFQTTPLPLLENGKIDKLTLARRAAETAVR
jgi:acyl-coenzyme A synthetase/AMP-(fatty) acid ligase